MDFLCEKEIDKIIYKDGGYNAPSGRSLVNPWLLFIDVKIDMAYRNIILSLGYWLLSMESPEKVSTYNWTTSHS